jgi:hypothetical protein
MQSLALILGPIRYYKIYPNLLFKSSIRIKAQSLVMP